MGGGVQPRGWCTGSRCAAEMGASVQVLPAFVMAWRALLVVVKLPTQVDKTHRPLRFGGAIWGFELGFRSVQRVCNGCAMGVRCGVLRLSVAVSVQGEPAALICAREEVGGGAGERREDR
eukprot:983789-Rhodomonas_salina.1